jgi:GNAT superfamily N-acetyltransferase
MYDDHDRSAVLELLEATMGGGPAGERSTAFFRWKHQAGPFGPSFMLVADTGDRIVGLRAFMRWRFRAGDRTIRAVRAVDTATHPEFQGRGIFSDLTRAAIEMLTAEADLIFNTPNEKSLPGYLKMGWQITGTVPISVRARHPIRVLRSYRSIRDASAQPSAGVVDAQPAASVLHTIPDLDAVLAAADPVDGRIQTDRSSGYLRWRYGESPLDYRAVRMEEGGATKGLAVFRVRPRGRLREATVSELIVPAGDLATARRLLRAVRRSASVDHLTCHFPSGGTAARAASRSGYLRVPLGITLVTRDLGHTVEPDPTRLSAWSLTLGDLEVF